MNSLEAYCVRILLYCRSNHRLFAHPVNHCLSFDLNIRRVIRYWSAKRYQGSIECGLEVIDRSGEWRLAKGRPFRWFCRSSSILLDWYLG